VGAAREEPAGGGERAGGGLGSEEGDVEEGEGYDAAGGKQGGGDGEDLSGCCEGGHVCMGWVVVDVGW